MLPLKSTIVRSILMKGPLLALGHLSPELAGSLAIDLALTPRKSRIPVMGQVNRPHYQYRRTLLGQTIAVYEWKGHGPKVLLSHGWSSCAYRLQPLIELLRQWNCAIVAFDHIAHGHSSGTTASLPRFTRTTAAMLREFGPFDLAVGHSMGAAALALARKQGRLDLPLILLAPPPDVRPWFARFSQVLGLPAGTHAVMERLLERQEQFNLEEIGPETSMEGISSPTLVVLGDQDREVPVQEGSRYHRGSASELRVLAGLDHRDCFAHPLALECLASWMRDQGLLRQRRS